MAWAGRLVAAAGAACALSVLVGISGFSEWAARSPNFLPFGLTSEQAQPMLDQLGLSMDALVAHRLALEIIEAVAFLAAGALILWRKSSEIFGLYLALVFFLFGAFAGNFSYVLAMYWPALSAAGPAMVTLAWMAFFPIFYLFPDGRFYPAFTRWLVPVFVVLYVYIQIFPVNIENPAGAFFQVIMVALVLVGLWSQVARYRVHSTLLERQQTKLVVFVIAIFIVTILFTILSFLLAEGLAAESNPALLVLVMARGTLSYLAVSAFPASIAVSVMRYRLWEIDFLIRRTLVWGMVTALLGAAYYGGVTLVQALFVRSTGQNSAVSIVLSTLAIAALASPIYRRVQNFVDQRFFRKKYSAEQALASFGGTIREVVEAEALGKKLLDVVEETVQPDHVSLWVRPAVKP